MTDTRIRTLRAQATLLYAQADAARATGYVALALEMAGEALDLEAEADRLDPTEYARRV